MLHEMMKKTGDMPFCKQCIRVAILRHALKLACWAIKEHIKVEEPKDKSMMRLFYDRAENDLKCKNIDKENKQQ